MNDLISRSALRQEILDKFPQGGVRGVFLAFVDDSPTIEAVPVVRGEWIKNRWKYYCSHCNEEFSDELPYINDNFEMPNFCPSCGADMRKKVE